MKSSIYKCLAFAFSILLYMNSYTQPGESPFDSLWVSVTAKEQEGLTRTALQEVQAIRTLAQKNGNRLQYIKTLIYQLKYEATVEEGSYLKGAELLEAELAEASFPEKQILESYLAWYYWQYYQNFRYRILERNALDVAPEDFQTWDAKQFHQKIGQLMLTSLEPEDALKQESIEKYEVLLVKQEGSAKFRPTLFDLLAHQALSYFSQEESRITQAQELFTLELERGMVDAPQFVKEEFVSPDTLAPLYVATRLYQRLLAFHLEEKDTNPSAFIELDLARLTFVSQNGKGEKKPGLYRSCLQEILKEDQQAEPVYARVYHAIAQSYFESGNMYTPLTDTAHQWDLKEAHDLCKRGMDRFPGSLGAILCQNLLNRIEFKNLELQVEKVIVPNQPYLAYLSAKNVDKVYFKVVEAPEKRGGGYDRNRMINLLNKKKVISSWELEIPLGINQGDFQRHSTEVIGPALPVGNYVLLASDTSDFSPENHGVCFAMFQASELSYFSRNNQEKGVLEVYVVDRAEGEPQEKVAVQAYYWDYNTQKYKKYGSKAYTNKEGYVSIPAGRDYRSFELEMSRKKDRYRTESLYAYYYNVGPQEEREDIFTHFFLDRKIFRPGQTVHFKGIVLSRKGEKHSIKKNYPLSVALYDVNGEEVSSLNLQTNEFGSVSGSFPTPTSGLLGRMSLQGEGGTADFSVEEYKRPTFEVHLDQPVGPMKLGDQVKVNGKATTYSGAALSDSEVRYRVVRRARFPYWRWYSWRPSPSSPEREIASGTLTSDDAGAFEVDFSLVPDDGLDPATKPVFTYEVFVDVIDLTGETHSKTLYVQAGYDPFVLELGVEESVSNKAPGKLIVSCDRPPAEGEEIVGKLEIFQLQNPERAFISRKWTRPDIYTISQNRFEDAFPNLPYKEEDSHLNWPKAAYATAEDFPIEASASLALQALEGAKPGKYLLQVSALEGEVVAKKYVTVYNPNAAEPAFPQLLAHRISKRKAEPGESVDFSLQVGENKTWVLYELEQDGKVLDSEFIRVRKNKGYRVTLPVKESYRGNVSLSATWVRHNRFGQLSETVIIPWSNKELALEWQTFRSELEPGSSDQWSLKIKGPQSEAVTAEMVATLYDASLDQFRSNAFGMYLYPSYYRRLSWEGRDGFTVQAGELISRNWNPRGISYRPQEFDKLNGFGYLNGYMFAGGYFGGGEYAVRRKAGGPAMLQSRAMAAPAMEEAVVAGAAMDMIDMEGDAIANERSEGFLESKPEANAPGQALEKAPPPPPVDFDQVEIRKDFSETAFFFPHLQTDDSGYVQIDFTMPEALTRWKFLGLAHTQDLAVGTLSGELVTKKKLMVKASLPRFLREGDKGLLSAKVSNMADSALGGSASIRVLDARTMEPVGAEYNLTEASRSLKLEKEANVALSWEINIPEGSQALVVQIAASASGYTDGEEHVIPIFPNRMLVTESLPLAVRGKGTHTFSFDKLKVAGDSETLAHQSLTLEFTTNPIWYAIQSLPYLMEFPHECTEQIFSRYYANALAHHVATTDPKIQQVFTQWQQVDQSLESALHKNEDLKGLLLQETPWVLQAKSEKERKQRMGVLFDVNRMASELSRARNQILERQYGTGGFAWFPGMRPSRYITQLIATGFGNLQHIGVNTGMGNAEWIGNMATSIAFLDREMKKDYEYLKKYKVDLEKNNLSSIQVQYLYMRSFYEDIPLTAGTEKAVEYYRGQAREYWVKRGNYDKGMLALAFHRGGEKPIADKIMRSLKENAVFSEEQGMYWKDMSRGYYWYQAPIERHALLLEAFNEVGKDQEAVEGLQVWLLKNKQTNDWKTTRATVAACQALVSTNKKALQMTPEVNIQLGDIQVDPSKNPEMQVEAGTGYFRETWDNAEVNGTMGEIRVEKPQDGVAWGALYWQYFEQLDKITFAETPLSLKKALYVERLTDKGPELTKLEEEALVQPGDKVMVRIELRVDRDMEYVHMKDMRAAGFEPINVISRYKYQAGLGYYESTRDAATHFFFDFLPKGTHVFEYPLRATHTGDYSNGIASIQCMYAPEFTSHSDGIRLRIGEE